MPEGQDWFVKTLSEPPPEGWERGYVTLYLERPNEDRFPIEAWIHGPFAVHDLTNGRANVTHIPTGRRIYTLDSKEKAVEFVGKVEPLGDWSAIADRMPSGSELYAKVRPIIDEYEDYLY